MIHLIRLIVLSPIVFSMIRNCRLWNPDAGTRKSRKLAKSIGVIVSSTLNCPTHIFRICRQRKEGGKEEAGERRQGGVECERCLLGRLLAAQGALLSVWQRRGRSQN